MQTQKKSNKKGIVTGLLRGPSFKYTKTYWLDIPSQMTFVISLKKR